MPVHQPLVPSFSQLDLTLVPQYDDKLLLTVYKFGGSFNVTLVVD